MGQRILWAILNIFWVGESKNKILKLELFHIILSFLTPVYNSGFLSHIFDAGYVK